MPAQNTEQTEYINYGGNGFSNSKPQREIICSKHNLTPKAEFLASFMYGFVSCYSDGDMSSNKKKTGALILLVLALTTALGLCSTTKAQSVGAESTVSTADSAFTRLIFDDGPIKYLYNFNFHDC
jgi:hypothetical protein